MYIMKGYPDGIFAWADLQTPDVEAASAFYSALFGWDIQPQSTPEGVIYHMATIDGHSVVGLNPSAPDMVAQGMGAFWLPYVIHRDVDAVVERAVANGGMVAMPAMDVMEEGRMALFVDPTGATFGVWQPGNHTGAQVINSPNTLVWNELHTHDVDRSREFYKSVFGWSGAANDIGYVMFDIDGRVHSGAMALDESWGDAPSYWMTYFLVEDVDSKTALAESLGATIAHGPFQAGDIGRMTVLMDPQGGAFAMIQYNSPAAEPPGL